MQIRSQIFHMNDPVWNNWEFPEGMYYLGNTTLRTSPRNIPLILSLYIYCKIEGL